MNRRSFAKASIATFATLTLGARIPPIRTKLAHLPHNSIDIDASELTAALEKLKAAMLEFGEAGRRLGGSIESLEV